MQQNRALSRLRNAGKEFPPWIYQVPILNNDLPVFIVTQFLILIKLREITMVFADTISVSLPLNRIIEKTMRQVFLTAINF